MCRYVRVVSPPQMPALAEETVRYLVSLLMNESSRPVFWNLCCIREPDSNRLSLFSEDIGLSTTIEFDTTPLPKSLAEAQGSDVEAAAWCSGVDVFLVVLDLSQECISSLWIRRLYHAAEHFAPHASIQYLAMVKLIGDEAEPRYQDIRDYIDAVERRHRLCLNAYPAERSESLLGSLCYNDYFYRTEEIQGEAYSSEVLGRIGVAFAYSSVHTAGVMGYLEALLLIIRTLCHVRIEVSAEEHQVYNLLINTNMNFKSIVNGWWSKLLRNEPKEIRIALVGDTATGKTYTVIDLIHAIQTIYPNVSLDAKLLGYKGTLEHQLREDDETIKATKKAHVGTFTLNISGKEVCVVLQDVAGEAFKDEGKYFITQTWTDFRNWFLVDKGDVEHSVKETPDGWVFSDEDKTEGIKKMTPLEVLKDIGRFTDDSCHDLVMSFFNDKKEIEVQEHFSEHFKEYFKSYAFITFATDIIYCYLGNKKEEKIENYPAKVNDFRSQKKKKHHYREYILFRGLDEVLDKEQFKTLFSPDRKVADISYVTAVLRYGVVHTSVLRSLRWVTENPSRSKIVEELHAKSLEKFSVSISKGDQGSTKQGVDEAEFSVLISLGNQGTTEQGADESKERFFYKVTSLLSDWKTDTEDQDRISHVYFGAYPIASDGEVGKFNDSSNKVVFNPRALVGPFLNREPLGVFNLLFDILTAHDLSIPEDIKNDEVFSKIAGQS